MEVRAELKYTKSHEWVKEEGGVWTIGLTDYAQSALGDLVFVNLPEAGDSVEAGEVFGDVESVKAVSDVYSPVTGEVEEINEELLDAPEKINGATVRAMEKKGIRTEKGEFNRWIKATNAVIRDIKKKITLRSEERRVGKECRSRWSPYH